MKAAPHWIVGIDEVGRGPLAGPVSVCAIAMPYKSYKKTRWTGLTDSKKLSASKREFWHATAFELQKNGVIRIGLASQSAAQIDRKGISHCIRECITIILTDIAVDPKKAQILLDGGLKAPELYTNQKTIIRGDAKEKIISLASVIAKVTRDAYMTKIAPKYPGYGWEKNKGYGTATHRKSLKKLGSTRLHRKSYLTRILDNTA